MKKGGKRGKTGSVQLEVQGLLLLLLIVIIIVAVATLCPSITTPKPANHPPVLPLVQERPQVDHHPQFVRPLQPPKQPPRPRPRAPLIKPPIPLGCQPVRPLPKVGDRHVAECEEPLLAPGQAGSLHPGAAAPQLRFKGSGEEGC